MDVFIPMLFENPELARTVGVSLAKRHIFDANKTVMDLLRHTEMCYYQNFIIELVNSNPAFLLQPIKGKLICDIIKDSMDYGFLSNILNVAFDSLDFTNHNMYKVFSHPLNSEEKLSMLAISLGFGIEANEIKNKSYNFYKHDNQEKNIFNTSLIEKNIDVFYLAISVLRSQTLNNKVDFNFSKKLLWGSENGVWNIAKDMGLVGILWNLYSTWNGSQMVNMWDSERTHAFAVTDEMKTVSKYYKAVGWEPTILELMSNHICINAMNKKGNTLLYEILKLTEKECIDLGISDTKSSIVKEMLRLGSDPSLTMRKDAKDAIIFVERSKQISIKSILFKEEKKVITIYYDENSSITEENLSDTVHTEFDSNFLLGVGSVVEDFS